MDLYNGEITARRPVFDLVSDTLEVALPRSQDTAGLTVHSDQGWHCKTQPYRAMLAHPGVKQSMSRKENCFDNAVIESFFATLKAEYFHLATPDGLVGPSAVSLFAKSMPMCAGRLSKWHSKGRLSPHASPTPRHPDVGRAASAMGGNNMSQLGNHLLDLLPLKERKRFGASCEPVQLTLSEVLCEPGEITRYAYFPTTGFISLVAKVDQTARVEVGMVGNEGMLGGQVALGVCTAPLHAIVQGAGNALRIGAVAFRRELEMCPTLQKILNIYLHVLMIQLANSGPCKRFHRVSARLARWLLMSEDRAYAEEFYVTHEFLAYLLGVRRVGVTTAAGALQKAGLIKYHRGVVHVLDRSGLEQAACSCYASDQTAYADLLIRKPVAA